MKLRTIFSTCAIVLAGMATAAGPAAASQVLYDSAGFLQGSQTFEQSFNITGPGTLMITLSNVTWPVPLASLNMVLGTSSGLLAPEMGAGSQMFNVTGGPLFVQWFGTAQGPLDLGVYSMQVVFDPSTATPVPLPPSILLLCSALLALLAWKGLKPGLKSDRSLPISGAA
jgi:hypothetical protein